MSGPQTQEEVPTQSAGHCKACGRYTGWLSAHTCPPEFEVLDHNYTGDDWDDAYKVREADHEDAAQKAAEEMDDSCGEGPHERLLQVRKVGETEVVQVKVTFDYSVDYYARTVKP